MKVKKGKGQLNLVDRNAISLGIQRGDSFRTISRVVGKHPSTVSAEVRNNRTFIPGTTVRGNDCEHALNCHIRRLCDRDWCSRACRVCEVHDCRKICDEYVIKSCSIYEKPPYVCNACKRRSVCKKPRYVYNPLYAQKMSQERRSECRRGIRTDAETMKKLDRIITRGVKKGQSLAHIYASHQEEMPRTLRTIYNYVERNAFTIRNMDLRRKVGMKRRAKSSDSSEKTVPNYRIGRTYEVFLRETEGMDRLSIVEMDTVKGVRESGKRLLTMTVRGSVLLGFLIPDGTADSVIGVFDYLEECLGLDMFRRLFPVILTDNGSEFKRVEELELSENLEQRTSLFYCDPMASWQKPHIEKAHVYLRYILPKGKSLNKYTQKDITRAINHINSFKREELDWKSPYETITDDDEDMKTLMELLEMHIILPDDVHLKPDLISK